MTPWWDAQTGNTIGAILGSSFGLIGGGFGAFVGVMSAKGRGGTWVLYCELVLLAIGVGLATLGVIAIAVGQPHHVWYPLLLTGGVVSFAMMCLVPLGIFLRRMVEKRRLAANELRHG